MKRFIIMFIAATFLAGCAATTEYQSPGVCAEGDSVILQYTNGDPRLLGKALMVVNYGAMKAGYYTGAQANAALDKVESYLDNEGLTFTSFKGLLDQEFASAAVIILGDDINQLASLGGTSVISDCDKALIKKHIASERLLNGLN